MPFFSHPVKMFVAYYCDTQKQSYGEFAKRIGKQLCRSPFLNKVAGGRPIKKETPTVFLKNTSGRLL